MQCERYYYAKTIKISWKRKNIVNKSRVGIMYCFKVCEVNKN